jgi:hypothetical protein
MVNEAASMKRSWMALKEHKLCNMSNSDANSLSSFDLAVMVQSHTIVTQLYANFYMMASAHVSFYKMALNGPERV